MGRIRTCWVLPLQRNKVGTCNYIADIRASRTRQLLFLNLIIWKPLFIKKAGFAFLQCQRPHSTKPRSVMVTRIRSSLHKRWFCVPWTLLHSFAARDRSIIADLCYKFLKRQFYRTCFVINVVSINFFPKCTRSDSSKYEIITQSKKLYNKKMLSHFIRILVRIVP